MVKANSDVWILAEQAGGEIQRVSFELMTRALELAEKRGAGVSVMLLGDGVSDESLQELVDCGARRVVYVQHEQLAHFMIEPYSWCVVDVIREYEPEIILAGATSTGRTLMPYVAIKAHTGLTADCTVLDIDSETGGLLQTRPAIGGNIMATIKTPNHRPQMATVRPHSSPVAKAKAGRHGEIIKVRPDGIAASRIVREGFSPYDELMNIADADAVVAVGRGIKKQENLPIIFELAEVLNAAVGATRDVVDRGWLSYSHQIGLSGHTISPKLYIGVGLSGSIQHIAGMQTSENIIAINNDADANIFKIANYGIRGDLFEIVPRLTEQFSKK